MRSMLDMSCVLIFLLSTTNRGEGHRLEFLLISKSQAILHCLIQQFLTLVRAPAWTITVDDILGGQTKTSGQHS